MAAIQTGVNGRIAPQKSQAHDFEERLRRLEDVMRIVERDHKLLHGVADALGERDQMPNNSGYTTDYNKTVHGTANTAADLITSNAVTITKEKHEAKLDFDVKHTQRG